MKTLVLQVILVFMVFTMFPSDTEAGRYAICQCRGCRPEKFYCNYNTFGGCDCGSCRCQISEKPPSHTCCSNCKNGWWGQTKRKCWECPIARGCNYEKCGCW